jgi:transposase
MPMLADTVELVIGVDTHKDTHTAAVVQPASGAVVDQVTVPATPAGYQQLLRLADRQDGRRVWAIEGTGGYGAGLTRFLHGQAERVVELDRPKRAARRHGAKSDPLDATRAAREALGRDQLAQPRAAGHRVALSVRPAARRSAVQAATDAQRLRSPTTPGPSPRWCGSGGPTCWAAVGWARSRPPAAKRSRAPASLRGPPAQPGPTPGRLDPAAS